MGSIQSNEAPRKHCNPNPSSCPVFANRTPHQLYLFGATPPYLGVCRGAAECFPKSGHANRLETAKSEPAVRCAGFECLTCGPSSHRLRGSSRKLETIFCAISEQTRDKQLLCLARYALSKTACWIVWRKAIFRRITATLICHY